MNHQDLESLCQQIINGKKIWINEFIEDFSKNPNELKYVTDYTTIGKAFSSLSIQYWDNDNFPDIISELAYFYLSLAAKQDIADNAELYFFRVSLLIKVGEDKLHSLILDSCILTDEEFYSPFSSHTQWELLYAIRYLIGYNIRLIKSCSLGFLFTDLIENNIRHEYRERPDVQQHLLRMNDVDCNKGCEYHNLIMKYINNKIKSVYEENELESSLTEY